MNYLAMDRPNIQYQVGVLCRDMAKPKQSSWKKTKRAARYLVTHPEMTHMYKKVPSREVKKLRTYLDSDWAGRHTSRSSASGGMLTLADVALKSSSFWTLDIINQNMNGVQEDYERTREKVFTWVSNKVTARGGPVPMDVGKFDQFLNYDGPGFDVDAVGSSMQCYTCNGWDILPESARRREKETEPARTAGKGYFEAQAKGHGRTK
jgi:hypothetical protein